MIQAVQTTQVSVKTVPSQREKQESVSNDTFLSMVSEKLSEQTPIEQEPSLETQEKDHVTSPNTTVMTAVQELIAQLTQDPNLILPQQTETVLEDASISIVPIATESISALPQQQAMLQEMQLASEIAKQTVETVALEELQLPQKQEQLPVEPVFDSNEAKIELMETQQPKPTVALQPNQTVNHVKTEMEAMQPIVFTNETAHTSQNELLQQEATKTFAEEAVAGKKQDDKTQNPIAFSMVSKPTETQNPVIIPISDEASKLEPVTQTQIADEITMHLSENKSEFTMQLNPEHLGKVSVKLVSENGMLTVELHAENPKTQSLLLSNANEIKELVQATTNQTTQIIASSQSQELQQNNMQQENQRENAPQQQQQNNLQNNESDGIDFDAILKELQAKSNDSFIR